MAVGMEDYDTAKSIKADIKKLLVRMNAHGNRMHLWQLDFVTKGHETCKMIQRQHFVPVAVGIFQHTGQ